MKLERIAPTVGLNVATLTKSQGEFLFWDVGGQKTLRKLWANYFGGCDGVVFVIDGADEGRFDEVRGVIDELYTRRVLDEAGVPKIEKRKGQSAGRDGRSGTAPADEEDLEGGGGGADQDEESIVQILQGLPCLFLLNKNDKPEFRGVE